MTTTRPTHFTKGADAPVGRSACVAQWIYGDDVLGLDDYGWMLLWRATQNGLVTDAL